VLGSRQANKNKDSTAYEQLNHNLFTTQFLTLKKTKVIKTMNAIDILLHLQ
jgi:hypothetical protein